MKNTKNTSLTVFPLPLLSRGPPVVLLLLLLLLFGPGGSPCHALDWQCRANITVTAEDTAGVNITTVRDLRAEHIKTTLFVQPQPGFHGVSLVGKVSDGGDAGEVVVAWFSLHETCLHGYDRWWQLNVAAYKIIYPDGVIPDQLGFVVQVHHCHSVCHRGPFRNVLSLQVRAHGASRWSLTDCTQKIPVQNIPAPSPVPCLDPPPTTGVPSQAPNPKTPAAKIPTPGVPPHASRPKTPAAKTPTPGVPPHAPRPITPAAKRPTSGVPPHIPSLTTPAAEIPPPSVFMWVGVGVAMLVVVTLVVVVVVVVVRRRRQQMKPEEADQQRTSPAAPGVGEEVVNSLYEPFDRPTPSCVREEVVNSLYEPFDRPAPSCVREEVVNSLYEPFDRPAPSCVREEVVNSLYEPFDNLRQPPPAVTAPTYLQKR